MAMGTNTSTKSMPISRGLVILCSNRPNLVQSLFGTVSKPGARNDKATSARDIPMDQVRSGADDSNGHSPTMAKTVAKTRPNDRFELPCTGLSGCCVEALN